MSSNHRSLPYISRAKVTPPATSHFEVPRQAMLDRAGQAETSRAVLVHAPAGFGKTTFMTQLLARYRQQRMTTVWLTLDAGDNDVSRFLSGFATAIAGLQPDAPQQDLGQLRNTDLVAWILDQIGTHQTPLAIFFDDFEAIRNPVVLGLVARGIEAIPHKTCLVIGSRTLPDIGLARLRARGSLTEIDAASLRFSVEETQDFLTQRRGVGLSSTQVERLQCSTEGWVTALWLASLALENHGDTDKFLDSFSGSNAAIAAYLAEDVLAALPEPLRLFLLRSSLLDELSPALCNAICGCSDSLDMLRELERHQLFLVPIDEQRDLYRYHSLFLDFLRHQMQRRYNEELPALHLAACNAYLAQGRVIPAIRHALQCGNTQIAIDLLHQHVDMLLSQGRLRLLAECIGQLPKTELQRHPRLQLIRAWCTAFTWGPKEALTLVADIDSSTLSGESAAYLLALRPMLLVMMDQSEQAYEMGTQSLAQVTTAYPFAWAMLNQALTQASILLGRHQEAHQYVDEARRAQSDSAGAFGFVLAESAEALLDMMAGRLKQATARLRLATTMLEGSRRRDRNGNALAAVQLAETLYESDECEEALRLLLIYTPLVQDLGLSDGLITAHTLLARIADDKGDRDRALQMLSELENVGHRLGLPRVSASARLERAMQTLAHGDQNGALEQLALAEQTFPWTETATHWGIANDTLTPTIGRLRWMIRSGASGKAIAPLRSELAEAERLQRGRRALKLRILLAEALYRDNQAKMALRTLERALKFAQTEGFVRTFLEEGATVQVMLRELHNEREDKDATDDSSLERWLRSSATAQPAAGSNGTLVDPLTQKELKVLNLLGQGLSNAAMAEKLFVSDSTVRTHLRNINLKLHASSRTQAIAIARRMGLCT
ncbi:MULTISPECIES: LuxR C-terminal-related transcriptional regulator [unclassified Pseudomonas]|uniref:LuxR C-terminal-related transcriptional regulator n=1 Tax=unclassified Pseudomonas TaxID=196821 RepID=UPI000876623B|nr:MULTISPECIES: LuxR C-terminal-related transcriptional regulator [unclassified Pseudomonas]SCZ20751.1 LuxR family transcriptional regulator, maltose regulon positive regulatory protein [Pseudomonas sp. NFACC44-2]SDA43831.1 LuxR family transcriptional regulator, maltose regulon positive regulatory protein [Pseudomonas sp. NFACC51]SFH10088.1 LuxR family transcriptional regulator, maltose regulon positive regulatory protein [Pseudomonas sp. NFACC54]SFS43830.1 LuxR family transcriptional regulato